MRRMRMNDDMKKNGFWEDLFYEKNDGMKMDVDTPLNCQSVILSCFDGEERL